MPFPMSMREEMRERSRASCGAKHHYTAPLLRRTLPAGAGFGVAAAATVFFVPPLTVPITVLLTGSFFVAVGLVTIVVLTLVSLASLLLLPLPLRALDTGGGTVVCFLVLPAAEVAAVEVGMAFLAPVARVDFAFSTILVSMPAAPPADIGGTAFIGDAGRARYDLTGEAILVGGRVGGRACGRLREFGERGERTWSACFVRETARDAGAVLTRLLGLEISSFSLSSISTLQKSC